MVECSTPDCKALCVWMTASSGTILVQDMTYRRLQIGRDGSTNPKPTIYHILYENTDPD